MSSDDLDKALKAWRKAEQVFSKAAAPYIDGTNGTGQLSKKAAIELAELRSKADSRMQRYFKKALK